LASRLRVLLIVTLVGVVIGVGFFFLRGPKPFIEIKAEPLWNVGPLEITNTLFTSWLVVIFLIGLAFFSTRKLSLIPSRWQNFIESVIEMLFNLAVSTAGEKNARRFFPVIATIFVYVVISNWSALLPVFNAIGEVHPIETHGDHFKEEAVVFEDVGGINAIMPNPTELEFEVDEAPCEELAGEEHDHCIEEQREIAVAAELEDEGVDPNATFGLIAPYLRGVNTDLMSTLSLAIAAVFFVEYWGVTALGFTAYAGKFFNFGALIRGGVIDFFVGILEFIAEVARIISFTFRLFGNMLAGEILLLIMTFLVPLLLALPFYGLELFVGVIQAFVFAMLTLVFGVLAVSGHGDGHEDEAGHGAAAAHGD
jgi:F-type H+-transporting ATPase subunit a